VCVCVLNSERRVEARGEQFFLQGEKSARAVERVWGMVVGVRASVRVCVTFSECWCRTGVRSGARRVVLFLFLAPITHGGSAPPSRERRTRARRRGHRRGARSPASPPSRPWSRPFQPPHARVAQAGGSTALWRSGRRCWSVLAESECARTPAGPPPTPAAWGPNPARSLCLLSLTHPTATTPNIMASDEEAIKLHAAGLGAEGASEFRGLSGAMGSLRPRA